ncbi:unnamed protein product, partial [Pelagomonas calceolata]
MVNLFRYEPGTERAARRKAASRGRSRVDVALDLALEVQQRAVEVRGDPRHGAHEPRRAAALDGDAPEHGRPRDRVRLGRRGRPPQRRAGVDVDAGVLVARQRVVVLVGRARGEAEVRGGRGVEGEAPVPGRPGRVVEEEQEAVRHDDQRLVAGVEHDGALVVAHAPPDQGERGPRHEPQRRGRVELAVEPRLARVVPARRVRRVQEPGRRVGPQRDERVARRRLARVRVPRPVPRVQAPELQRHRRPEEDRRVDRHADAAVRRQLAPHQRPALGQEHEQAHEEDVGRVAQEARRGEAPGHARAVPRERRDVAQREGAARGLHPGRPAQHGHRVVELAAPAERRAHAQRPGAQRGVRGERAPRDLERPQLVGRELAPLLGGAVREVQFIRSDERPLAVAVARGLGALRRAVREGHEEPRVGLVAHVRAALSRGRPAERVRRDARHERRRRLQRHDVVRRAQPLGTGPAAVDAVDPLVEAVVVEEERGRRAGRVRDLELDEAVLLLLRVRREVHVGLGRRHEAEAVHEGPGRQRVELAPELEARGERGQERQARGPHGCPPVSFLFSNSLASAASTTTGGSHRGMRQKL